eukprot:5852765-Amphidinium_carterae.1
MMVLGIWIATLDSAVCGCGREVHVTCRSASSHCEIMVCSPLLAPLVSQAEHVASMYQQQFFASNPRDLCVGRGGFFGLGLLETGCAITHSIVIPLDVVKTRMQTEPG